MSRTCCFTGHRPNKLPWGYDEQDARCRALKRALAEAVADACDDGYTHFLVGMAMGVDFYAAEAVLELKAVCPQVYLEAAIPCLTQADRFPRDQRARYERLLAQCDLQTLVQERYDAGCMLRRNRYMVARSQRVIAVYDGVSSGGTLRTLRYALSQGTEVVILDPNHPQQNA